MYYAIDFEKQMERRELCRKINEMLKEFSPRYRRVIIGRIWDNMTYKQLGEELGVTTERVRQMYLKTLRILKHPKRSHILGEYCDDIYEYRIKTNSLYNDDKVHVITLDNIYHYNSLNDATSDYKVWENKSYYIIGINCKNI